MDKKYKIADLEKILTNMADYIHQSIQNGNDITEYFGEIVTTGLFHDSEGKIKSYDENTKTLIVENEY